MSDPKQMRPVSRTRDNLFRTFCLIMSLAVILLVILVGYTLWSDSGTIFNKFGFGFLVSTEWDPVQNNFGAWPFIFGTLVSSLLALAIATPLAVSTAIFLTELAPMWMRQPLTFLVEMLAAIPSVIFGLWGIFIMIPWLRGSGNLEETAGWHWPGVFPLLEKTSNFLPIFKGPIYGGACMLTAAIIIAIMILPIITSVSREILRSVPDLQREAAYGLGATRWEVTRIAVLSYAKKGIFGAMILGLGRALGETMAVTMVIGNTPQVKASLFAPAHTLASVIANEFAEATTDEYRSALVAIGLVLLGVTLVINICARVLLKFGGVTAGAVN